MNRLSLAFILASLGLAAGTGFLTQCKSTDQFPPESEVFDPMSPTRVPDTVVFERDLKPFLQIECVQCHNHKDARENAFLNLETRQAAMTTGLHPPVIRPGDPENSLFVQVLELDMDHPTNMPPAPDKIWGVRLAIIKKWIREGAEWPENVRMVRPQDWAE